MIEFHNYKGVMSLCMRLENMGWKNIFIDHEKELERRNGKEQER